MKKRPVLAVLILTMLFAACAEPAPTTGIPAAPIIGMPQGTDGYPWWNDSIFYEIFVRSFYDSNVDGIGDFNGITQKLDYLNDGDPETTTDLGVTGIWLMPINPSPSYHGYDVTDYYGVNPDYGTMDDFRNLLSEGHKRGIRIIIDLVMNHTSSQHAWFQDAWDPNSPYHDWYIWSNNNPGFPGPWGQQVWYSSHGQYYYALFWDQMPDLNYNNPAVTAEMEKVTRFWLQDVGVDGFRLDAARHLIEDGRNQVNTNATHTWYQQFHTFYKAIDPQAVTVGELAGEDAAVMASYTGGGQIDLSFDFGLATAFVRSAEDGNAGSAIRQMRLDYKLIPPLQFATFLTNHDQDRLMTQLGDDPNKVKVAASMLLTAPGVPFIYYGDEVGLQGQKPDEQIRRPMQWSGDPQGGFSAQSPWESLGANWETLNVAAETVDPASIMAHYRQLISIRNQHAALRVGDLNTLTTLDSGLYAILRLSPQEAVLVLVNLTGTPITDCRLVLKKSGLAPGTYTPLPILGTGPFTPLIVDATGGFSLWAPVPEVPAYGTVIVQLRASAP